MSKQEFELGKKGQKIRGVLYLPDSNLKKIGILFLHGWTGKPNDRAAEMLASHGFYAMTFSMRGHNNSDGDIKKVSARDSLEDSKLAYDYFVSQIPKSTQVAVAGNSYGGYIASMLSGERKLTAVSMRAPASYLDYGFDLPRLGRGSEDPKEFKWRHAKVHYSDNKGYNQLHRFEGPVQIIEAELDELVPHQTVMNYADAVKDKTKLDYQFMKGWPHSLGDHPARNKEFQTIFLAWVKGL